MTAIVRIDDEVVDAGEFMRLLKLTGQFESLIEQLVRDKLTVRAAKKHGVVVTADDIQTRADQFRRMRGLHRAADMNHYLDALGVSLDEFEVFITDTLYQEKMLEQVGTDDAIEEYFKLNSPKFDSDRGEPHRARHRRQGEGDDLLSARRSRQLRGDGARTFDRRYARRRRRDRQGAARALKADIEAKMFNAALGDLLGPFLVAGSIALRDLRGHGEVSGDARRRRRG